MKTMKVLFEVGFRSVGKDAMTIDKIVHAHRTGEEFEIFGEKFRPFSLSYSGPQSDHYKVEMLHIPEADGPVNTVEPGKRIPVAFSDPEMQRAYDAGEPFKTPDEKRIEHLENLLASASRYVEDSAEKSSIARRLYKKIVDAFDGEVPQKSEMRGLVVMPPRMIKALEADQLTGRFGYYGRVPEGAATEFYNAALAHVEELNDSTGKGHESFTLPQIVALLRGDK